MTASSICGRCSVALQPLRRALPAAGLADLLRQILLFCGAYWLYRLVRGRRRTAGSRDGVRPRARRRPARAARCGLFVEPAVQRLGAAARGWSTTSRAGCTSTRTSSITTVTLAFIYLRRNEHFYFVRNMFMVAMGLALVVYVVFPTAPPRLLPELGFTDSVARLHRASTSSDSSVNALVNPYAAVPSMHVGFALMLGVPMVAHGAPRAGPRRSGRCTRRS